MPQLGLGLRANVSGISFYDGDAAAYFSRAGVTDAAAKKQINDFVVGVKSLGLWNNMVSWPLRSAQNSSSPTTQYSLGGLGIYDATLVSSPSQGVNGITITSTAKITDLLGAPTFPTSLVVVGRRVAGTGGAQWEYVSNTISRQLVKRMYANNSSGIGIAGVGYIMLVNNNALTLTDNFEMVTGVVPSATNSSAEFFVNTTKPAQTAGAASWGTGSATGATLVTSSDGQFEASLHAVFNTAINVSNFYNLYKTTIGQGLSLP
jgi:hypothetical protein